MIISAPSVAGSGAISAVFASPAGDMLAIASTFPLLTNPPGRAAYMGQHLRQRLALHRRGEAAPFAVFDSLRLPINHVCFHPSDPVIAIAAGSYDGGYLFEGDLWFWDWRSGRSWQPVKAVPEVERCRFGDDGRQLHILVRPWDEGWVEAEGADDPFDRFYRSSVAYAPPAAADPAEIVIDPATAMQRHSLPAGADGARGDEAVERCLKDWLAVDALRRCGAIWDVAWLDARRVAAVHDGCLMEIHDVASGAVAGFGRAGHCGAAILRTTPPIVVAHAGPGVRGEGTDLLRFTGEALVDVAHFDGDYAFGARQDGALIGRLDRHRAGKARADVVMTSATAEPRLVDLGHYDCFNHFLGIDGAPEFFIIQGTPPNSHLNKRLCRVEADGTVATIWSLLPDDGSHASHAMECLAVSSRTISGRPWCSPAGTTIRIRAKARRGFCFAALSRPHPPVAPLSPAGCAGHPSLGIAGAMPRRRQRAPWCSCRRPASSPSPSSTAG